MNNYNKDCPLNCFRHIEKCRLFVNKTTKDITYFTYCLSLLKERKAAYPKYSSTAV